MPYHAPLALANTPYTIAYWVNWAGMTSSGNGSVQQSIIAEENEADHKGGFALCMDNRTWPGPTPPFVHSSQHDGSTGQDWYAQYAPTTGVWTHMAQTFDGSTRYLYANGALVASVATPTAVLKASKRGMFIHWGIASFEDVDSASRTDPLTTFNPTGCDTDQWAATAKAAGMGSLCFVTIHADRAAMWNSATTSRNVMNTPLGMDVLAKVRQSCDKYGLGLGLYYDPDGHDASVKQAQLRELLTNYGDIDYMFFEGGSDGDGGMNPQETANFVHSIQSDCLTTCTDRHSDRLVAPGGASGTGSGATSTMH